MKIEVRYFASFVERAGVSHETVEIEDASDVAALWAVVVARHPRLAEIGIRPLVACDLEYANWDAPLTAVTEVAFLPPVSGG